MSSSQLALIASLAAVAAVAAGLTIYYRFRRRGDPETLRRERIAAEGRFIEGMAIDYQAGVVFYRWTWRGVQYESSQDVRSLEHLLPDAENLLIGPVTVKFLAKNPSNSIVISEKWSGFRGAQPRSVPET